jgi:UDP-N-acetylglucosamine--N-acetylmuramyl-(pentapeptide) pyrophosphoryl-undecaprenol N-acetylglucosamine transferase
LDPKKKTIFVFGGSLGASSINRVVKECAEELSQNGIQFIWQTGKSDTALADEMQAKNIGWVGTFIDAMQYAYAAADIVVCRSGALTIAEVTRLGKAAILVPYPYAAADHQTFNAQVLAEKGAAILIEDKNVRSELKNACKSLLNDPDRIQQMSNASLQLGTPNAGHTIAQRILELAKTDA